jgi:TolA-binding protein
VLARDGAAAMLRPGVFGAAAEAFSLARQARIMLDDPHDKQTEIEIQIAEMEREVTRLRSLQMQYAKGTQTNGIYDHI